MKTSKEIFKITLSAIFLALAFVLPFLTGQIPEIGSMLCPMHIPVILCGFICGWKYGLIVGLVAPILRSLSLGMPPLFPKKIPFIYVALIISMLCGRIIWGIAMFCCMGLNLEKFGLTSFWLGGFVNAIPGIIVQIVIIPIIIMVYSKLKKQSN